MAIAWGLVFLALTLYFSTLTYALREASRAGLLERLPADSGRKWIEWLDRHDSELKVATAFLRLLSSTGVVFFASYSSLLIGSGTVQEHQLVWRLLEAHGASLGLLLVFGVAVPHAISRHAPESVVGGSRRVLAVIQKVMAPVTALGRGIDFVVMRLLGKSLESGDQESERLEKEILEAVTEGEMHGAVDEEQKEIIESVFELPDTTVAAIMTPRTDIVAISADSSFEDVRQIVVRGGHSRIPVYQNTLDTIIGVLYAKDLLKLRPGEPFDARRLMRSVPFIPESKGVSDLLDEFRQGKVHIAIVLDEYGGTAGLVTIEDIIEELVGEIADEYDPTEPPALRRLAEDTIEVAGQVHISEVNAELGLNLPETGEYETIGGFVFSTLGRIPAKGEEFAHENLVFQVVDAEPRKINRLRIRMTRPVEEAVEPTPA